MVGPTLTLLLAFLMSAAASAAPAAELWSRWDVADEGNPTSLDHSAWQNFLDRFVTTLADNRTVVDYRSVDSAGRRLLDGYIEHLTETDPRSYNRREQLAYWINLYNALTVRVVLDHPGKGSIQQMGRWFFSIGPWDGEMIELAGESISLGAIEHRILRPIWKDHRIHFVVNCASLGCPNLGARAYTGQAIEAMLDQAQREFLQHPRAVQFDEDGSLVLSRIFNWYRSDFAVDRSALFNYLTTQRPDLAGRLNDFHGKVIYRYDWQLNQTPR